MKRITSVILVMVFLLVSINPVWAVEPVADISKDKAISIAKQFLNLSNDYKLRHISFRMDPNGKTYWNFHWNSNQTEKEASVSAEIDAVTGKLRSFNRWSIDNMGEKKIEYNEAQMIAEDFARRVEPDKFSQTVAQPMPDYFYYDAYYPEYFFSFNRTINGYPYWDNAINVGVSRATGEVISYYCNWDEETISVPANKITPEKAKELFFSKAGLDLGYVRMYNDEVVALDVENAKKLKEEMIMRDKPAKATTYLAYYPKSTFSPMVIDAVTGEFLSYSGEPLIMPVRDNKPLGTAGTSKTPREVDMNDALVIAKSVVNVPSDANLMWVNYDENTEGTYPPTWNFNWSTQNGRGWHISVGVNASTGEVTSLHSYQAEYGFTSSGTKISKERAKDLAIEFLGKIASEKLDQLTFDPYPEENLGYPVYSYDFRFTRLVNGLPFPDNNITVGISTEGAVLNYWSHWEKLEFPPVENVIGEEKAKEIFGREVRFEPGYVKFYKNDSTYTVKFVYRSITSDRFVDAKTGEIRSRAMYHFPWRKALDIEGHWAQKDIEKLTNLNIITVTGDSYKPDEAITRGEMTQIIAKALGLTPYYPENPTFTDVSKTNLAYGYIEAAFKVGIVSGHEGKFNPNDQLTREQLAVILTKAMELQLNDDLTVLESYKDAEGISEWAKSSVAITTTLGIFKGDNGYFKAKGTLSKAQAAAVVARMLEQN